MLLCDVDAVAVQDRADRHRFRRTFVRVTVVRRLGGGCFWLVPGRVGLGVTVCIDCKKLVSSFIKRLRRETPK